MDEMVVAIKKILNLKPYVCKYILNLLQKHQKSTSSYIHIDWSNLITYSVSESAGTVLA